MEFDYFNKGLSLIFETGIGAIIVFSFVLILTRIFGLKSFSKMTGFDFVNTVIIGNVAAMAISTGKPGILIGLVILLVVYFLNYLITRLRFGSELIEDVISNKPVLLMKNGIIIAENLKRCKVTENELRGKLREANVLRLTQAKAVILETTGDVSVLHEEDQDGEIDAYILEDVVT